MKIQTLFLIPSLLAGLLAGCMVGNLFRHLEAGTRAANLGGAVFLAVLCVVLFAAATPTNENRKK